MANSRNIKKKLKQQRPRSFLNKDFEAFRAELLTYARTYFPEEVQDFSEASMGGLFLEMAAYVGDVMSFYLDHQFNELDIETAVEDKNVERLVRAAGVKIMGASPATVDVEFSIVVDAETLNNTRVPISSHLPIISAGTLLSSNTGITFELTENLDFDKRNAAGSLLASVIVDETNNNNQPSKFKLKMTGLCTSGKTIEENFSIGADLKPFRTITLSSENVSDIVSVIDTEGNEYYEVEALTQDTVFTRVRNDSADNDLVSDNLEILPAPYRFISTTDRSTGLTTIRFGSGDGASLDDDIIPDPSEVSLPLFGQKKSLSRFTLDPNSLLGARTMGISPRSTTITVRYRAGGGISHNVGIGSITQISNLLNKFSSGTPSSVVSAVRASLVVNNTAPAAGGESELTLNELRSTALAFRNSQSRIVTKQDLIARVYTMPSNFGRVFRLGIIQNRNNPLATTMAIISRNTSGQLVVSPDTLKKNLRTYLNEFRLISDAIDIIDASVINIGIRYSIVVDPSSSKESTVQRVNTSLKKYMDVTNFQIDQPIVISDLVNLILNTDGVISQVGIQIFSLAGTVSGRSYSPQTINIAEATSRGIIVPPAGGIFEMRFPSDDIIGKAV